jgi:hypothetical protein
MSSALRAERRHLRRRPIIQHEMQIRVADSSRVELDKHIVGPCLDTVKMNFSTRFLNDQTYQFLELEHPGPRHRSLVLH